MSGLIYALPAQYAQAPAFFMHRTTLGYIRALTVSNYFAFQNTPNGVADANRGAGMGGVLTNEFINGAPVFCTSAMSALATSGFSLRTITYGDPSQYLIFDNGPLTISRNPYLYQASGVIALFSKFRSGGILPLSEAFVYMLSHDD
jgi:HK97 family phage major capsid protein